MWTIFSSLRTASGKGAAIAAPLVLAALIYVPGLAAGGLPKWAVLYAVALVCLFFVTRFDRVTIAGTAFVAWAGLSGLWGADASWLPAFHKIATIFLIFLAAREAASHRQTAWAVALVCVVTIGAAAFYNRYPFINENFGTEWMLMALPLVLALRPRIVACLVASAVLCYLAFLNQSKMEFAILPIMAAAFFAFRRQWSMAVICALLPLAGAAVIPRASLMESIGPRLEIWGAAIDMWRSYPAGVGLSSFDHLFPAYQPPDGSWLKLTQYAGAVHNEYLQVLVELGPVGLGFAGVFVFLCLRHAKESPALYAVIAVGLLALLGFPLQNAPTAMLAAVCLGIVAGRPEKSLGVEKGPLRTVVSVAVVAGIGLGAMEVKAHVLYGRAANIMGADPVKAFELNLEAHRTYPWDWQIRNQMFATFANMARTNKVQINARNLRQIFDISRSASPYSPRLAKAVSAMQLEPKK